jgi:hypothetical protein
MAYTSLKQTPEKVANTLPFQGNNLRAENNGDIYAVYSYSTLMATYNRQTGEKWENPNRYSVTTSKQMNFVRRGFSMIGEM